MSTETGFIGFFDILGYQSILENNDPEAIAETVLQRLMSLDTGVESYIINSAPAFKDTELHTSYKEHLKWLVFSDTILMSMAIPDDADTKDKQTRWIVFNIACALLQKSMLYEGLPLRGVITYGSYLIKGTCFAGRPIVEAYKLAQRLDLSACVFTPESYLRAKEIWPLTGDGKAIMEYLVPLKGGEDIKLPTLNYIVDALNEDPRDLVLNSFWAFNKDIPRDVQQKVLNTEQHIRFLSQRNRAGKKDGTGEEPNKATDSDKK